MKQRWITTGAMLVAGLLLVGACSSDDPADGAGPVKANTTEATTASPSQDGDAGETTSSADDVPIDIIDTDFQPVDETVAVGTTIEWTQVGDQPHSVTAVDGSFDSSPDCSPIDSEVCLGQGDDFSHTFEEPGEFTYYCRVHGLPDGTGMVGTITVK